MPSSLFLLLGNKLNPPQQRLFPIASPMAGGSMSVGSAIFLSGIFLSLVGLYAVTKDRWRWRIFAKRILLGIGSLLALAALAGVGIYAWQYIPWPIPQQAEYAQLKLGASPDEVNYIKGSPASVLGEVKDLDPGWQEVIDINKIEKGKTIRDFQEWWWAGKESRIQVTFDPTTKSKVISVECYSKDKLARCPPILGITDGSREDEVLRRLGEPDSSKITGPTRMISYERIGVFFYLEQQVVYMLGINDTKWVRK